MSSRLAGSDMVQNGGAHAPSLRSAMCRQFWHKGRSNHTPLRWMEASEVKELEPELHCTAALFSPTTGIVDAQR